MKPTLVLAILVFLTGCGGGHHSSVGPITTVTLSPSPTISLNAGDVLQMSVSATDAAGHSVLNQAFTFSSSNGSQIQIANNGLLCGGTWDSLTTPIVCNPASIPAAGTTTNLTATAQGVTSNTVTAFVHQRVTSVVVTPSFSGTTCNFTDGLGVARTGVSQNGTVQYNVTAFNSSGLDITSSVGAFNWTITDPTIGTLTSTSTSGSSATTNTVTAKLPGTTTVVASTNNTNPVNSSGVSFTECPVTSITATPNPISFGAVANTQQLTVTATDSLGAAVSVLPTTGGITLNYNTNSPVVATVSNTGLVTAAAPGTATITASCTPNTCNKNLNMPVFSNPAVIANVPGTTSNPTVYAASTATACSSTSNCSLIPITNNTVGTAISLGANVPNSLVFNHAGTKAYLGSTGGLIIVDATTNTVSTTATSATGKVLAVSPSDQFVVLSDTINATKQVFVFDQNANSVSAFPQITGATAADFTPDSNKAYVVSGSTLFVIQQGLPLQTVNIGSAANDVSVLADGALTYIAGALPPPPTANVQRAAVCNNAIVASPAPPTATPTLVKSLPDGSQMLGADSSKLDMIAVTITSSAACPPTFTDPLSTLAPTGVASFTPTQIVVTPDSKHAYITASDVLGKLLRFDFASSTATPITLVGASAATANTTSGGATPDSASVYVGATDSNIHRIDVAGGTDAQQIPVSISPDLVAVRP